jgi:arabinofuranosyltransferase
MVPAVLTRLVSGRWLLLGVAAIVLVVHSLAYNFVTDDAYISFVFSRNLAEHGELSFNLGSPVEGYTNFLWTVVLGLLMVVGISPEWSSRVLGTICALVTLYLVFRVVERALGRPTPWAAVPALLLASSSGFACWTSGGLETQLFTMLFAIALDGFVEAHERPRALRRTAVALALSAMTRPEGVMIAAVLVVAYLAPPAIAWLLRRITNTAEAPEPRAPGFRYREQLIAAVLFLAIWAPWFAWRWWYYGWPFPNTYYVKAAGPWANPQLAHEMRASGWYYVWVWLNQTKLVYALPLAALGVFAVRTGSRPVARSPRFALAVACALLAAVYVPYTVSVGGDFMGLHRFIMPLFVIAAIAVTLGLEWIVSPIPEENRTRAWMRVGEDYRKRAAIALPALLVLVFAGTQLQLTRKSLAPRNLANDHGIDTPAFLIVYTEDRAAIGRAMASCFREDDFSIVGGAGAQPYYARMRGIDVFGLVSERIAHEEPRIRARAGHTKFGSDPLLAQYDPAFVFSCYQIHKAADPQPRLPCAGYWLGRGYEQVTMHVPGMKQDGEYYTFLAKKARDFKCPGRVH